MLQNHMHLRERYPLPLTRTYSVALSVFEDTFMGLLNLSLVLRWYYVTALLPVRLASTDVYRVVWNSRNRVLLYSTFTPRQPKYVICPDPPLLFCTDVRKVKLGV